MSLRRSEPSAARLMMDSNLQTDQTAPDERQTQRGLGQLPGRAFWAVAFVCLAAARFPYTESSNFAVDGDESILGLMAKHMSEGREFPLFFYGQAYGLSLLETLPAAAAFLVFGPSPGLLTGSMFVLFLAGLVCYERAFYNLVGDREWSRWLTLILGLLPVWIVWSTKARGGYLSAFVLLGALCWLFSRKDVGARRATLAGALLAMLAHAQLLWTPGAIPLALLPWARGARPRYLAWTSGSFVGVAGALYLLASSGATFSAPSVFGPPHASRYLALPFRLYETFTGFFYMGEIRDPTALVSALAWLGVAGFFASLVAAGLRFAVRRHLPSGVAALALMGAVSFLPVLRATPPRYLLSATVLLVVAQAIWLAGRSRAPSRPLRVAIIAVVALLGAASGGMKDFRPLNARTSSHVEADLHELLDFLAANEVEAAYSVSGLLQWQIMFYGDEAIPVRPLSPTDRYPAYPAAVDSIRAERGRTVLVGPLSANVRETRSTQRIRVGRRQRNRTCWDCEREWKRMVVPLEPGRPSEARQLLRTQR